MLPQASNLASGVDFVFWFTVLVSLFFLVLVTGLMIYFAVKYSRKRNPVPTTDIEGNTALEVTWTIIPTILVLLMFWYGWNAFKEMRDVPDNAIVIKTTGQMWQWTFDYPNGKSSQELVVPLWQPVKLELASRDVNHSLFIPAFRVKEDVIPGMTNYVWFTATKEGVYDIECAEYCGQRHAYMLSKVHAVPLESYNQWVSAVDVAAASESKGLQLIKSKGCIACHSIDGKVVVGPSFKGLFGKQEVVVSGGAEHTVTVDEEHIHRALLEPTADVAKGFPPIMPSQKGNLTDDEITEIINYLKELK